VAVVAALGALAAPLIIYVSAPGFSGDPGKFELTVELTRITFPYIFFMSLVALAGGVLNTWSRFAIPAFTPVLLNLAFIGMALFAVPYFDPPVLALAWAVFLGGVLQLLLQIRPLMEDRHDAALRPRPVRPRRAPRHEADGAGHPRRVGEPDLAADQHHLRLLPRERQRVLAVLRRPPDGVSRRPARRRAGHHPAAQPLQDCTPTTRPASFPPCSTGVCA
jgi:hypothetical protein